MSPTTAQQSYPQVALLKQIQGVGTLIALTFLPTLEDPHRFRKIRDVGCYLRLQPGRRNSGQIDPQLHLSQEGDLPPANAAGARSAERRRRPKEPSGWTNPADLLHGEYR
jgi:transposase